MPGGRQLEVEGAGHRWLDKYIEGELMDELMELAPVPGRLMGESRVYTRAVVFAIKIVSCHLRLVLVFREKQ